MVRFPPSGACHMGLRETVLYQVKHRAAGSHAGEIVPWLPGPFPASGFLKRIGTVQREESGDLPSLKFLSVSAPTIASESQGLFQTPMRDIADGSTVGLLAEVAIGGRIECEGGPCNGKGARVLWAPRIDAQHLGMHEMQSPIVRGAKQADIIQRWSLAHRGRAVFHQLDAEPDLG